MRRLSLKRVLKGPNRTALEAIARALGATLEVRDDAGRVLFTIGAFADDPSFRDYPVGVEERLLGVLRGDARTADVARLLCHLAEREAEKLALAEETLERYKELTVLYDMSDAVSRVLDIGEVARMLVETAHRFLKGGSVALLLLDERAEWLNPIAVAGTDHAVPAPRPPDHGIEGRVLASGRAEMEDAEAGAILAAPLRSGDRVIGVLRTTHRTHDKWTAGDLKLLTALASNAGSAISHATLHAQRLREEALRGQIARDVSLDILAVARDELPSAGSTAVLLCDLSGAVRSVGVPEQDLTRSLSRAVSVALNVLLASGATCNLAGRERVVALFPERGGLAASADRAVKAASTLLDALMWSDERTPGSSAGVAITRCELGPGGDASQFLAAVSRAASLSSESLGRILVTEDVSDALAERGLASRRSLLPDSGKIICEVRL